MTTAPSSSPALLVLADGLVLRGEAFGATGTAVGEVVFNTGMSGYQEVMTDPSYSGQLVTFTYPELGNTGVNSADQEADAPHVRGVIARELAPVPSNWRSESSLDSWLNRHQVVGIRGIDTRALVRHLREGGAMNGAISTDGTTPQVAAGPGSLCSFDGWPQPGAAGDDRPCLHLGCALFRQLRSAPAEQPG